MVKYFVFVDSLAGKGILPDSLKKEFFRYLSFAQNLIDAKTKEELVDALEQAADPVGSCKQKRLYPMTVSISS